jgi:hypothetical protein
MGFCHFYLSVFYTDPSLTPDKTFVCSDEKTRAPPNPGDAAEPRACSRASEAMILHAANVEAEEGRPTQRANITFSLRAGRGSPTD